MFDPWSNNDTSRLLPFLWLKGEDEETLRRGVREVHESGCGAVCVESRTHPDFLGEGWWRDMEILLDECRSLGMKLWVLDDQHFPSGYAAGAATGTPYARMHMTERRMDVIGPVPNGAFVVQDDETSFAPGEGIVAVVACRRMDESLRRDEFVDIGGWKLGERIDLTDRLCDGMVYWDVPEGIWRVFVLSARYVSERTPPRYFANPLLPDSARLMIETIYEPHWEHFKDDFGKTFLGFFSDEPALRAGRGYHGVVGEYPSIPIPWRSHMLEILKPDLGEDARALLPGIWYDIGPETRRVRYAVMDTVSRLYGENYCKPLGDWCRAHGVSYIGHVIEQNNTHARLGSGAGHYFRAVGGQQMAGIDIVLHELRPEFFGVSHAWQSQDFEADDDFFRYMLGQMAVSCAHLDGEKRGRTMCEIFGAYGWQEDVEEMRYLAYCMLSRGVNYFTPHAFTLQDYPDPDSPPHFDKRNHPMMPFIRRLFQTMAKVGGMIDGGRHISKTGVVYYAEAEWANGTKGCMKTQTVVKALNQRQIECDILPIDRLGEADIDVLFVPYAESWPRKLFDACRSLEEKGVHVFFVDALPEKLSGGAGDIDELTNGLHTVPLSAVAETAMGLLSLPYFSLSEAPTVHLYPYTRQDGDEVYLLFNEDVRGGAEIALALGTDSPVYLLDPEEESCVQADARLTSFGQRVSVALEPGQMLILLVTDKPAKTTPALPPLCIAGALTGSWRISTKAVGETDFRLWRETEQLCNLTAPENLPRFTGTVRYEIDVSLPEGVSGLMLPNTCYCVNAEIDGRAVGARAARPYLFRFAPLPRGRHSLRLELVNTPVFRHRDRLSFFNCIKPTGVLSPVYWMTQAE